MGLTLFAGEKSPELIQSEPEGELFISRHKKYRMPTHTFCDSVE
jgi:hypothetical protein